MLAAEHDARVALGLKRKITAEELSSSMSDGSIADLVAWRTVEAAETILVPAGTIHAIGAGLVIAEIQQRSDTTYRIFDFGRRRNLHVEEALAVADAGPPRLQALPIVLTAARALLAKSPYFVLERLSLPSEFELVAQPGMRSVAICHRGQSSHRRGRGGRRRGDLSRRGPRKASGRSRRGQMSACLFAARTHGQSARKARTRISEARLRFLQR